MFLIGVFFHHVRAFLPPRVGRTSGNPWGWQGRRWHLGGAIVGMGLSVKYSFSGLLSYRWRVVVPSRFCDISSSGSFNSLLSCFVFFLRPLSGVRTDLFLIGLVLLLASRLRRTVWSDNLHRARTHVATVGGEWDDSFWSFSIFWHSSSHLLGMSSRGIGICLFSTLKRQSFPWVRSFRVVRWLHQVTIIQKRCQRIMRVNLPFILYIYIYVLVWDFCLFCFVYSVSV